MNVCSRLLASVVSLAVTAFGLGGCFETDIVDDISTEITIDRVGEPGEAIEVRKRFRFTYDPAEASGLYMFDSLLGILEPVDADLSFIHEMNVYVVDELEERTLVAVAGGFSPGQKEGAFDIVYTDDLRGFAREDSRVVFVFEVVPSSWYGAFPPEGITFLAIASLEIEL